MLGRILLTVDAVALMLGPWTQDFFSKTHIFNPRWPPHAKFHCGQTIGLGTILGLATLFFTWHAVFLSGVASANRRSSSNKSASTSSGEMAAVVRARSRDSLRMAAFTGTIYWVSGLLAIFFPGAEGLDPEFGGPGFPQGSRFAAMAVFGAVGSWLESRQSGW